VQICRIVAGVSKLFQQAEKLRLDGDEEASYILYMKAMNLLTKIQQRPTYQKEKQSIAKALGSNVQMNKYFENMDKLNASLGKRYKEKYPAEKKSESTQVAEKPPDSDEPVVPEEVRQTIDCTQLFRMIEEGHKLLIMDCRSEEDYEQSKISYHYTLNAPEKHLMIGMTEAKLQKLLPNESKVFWELRKNREPWIFIDWFSTRFNRNSPIWHLREILTLWDQDLEKKPEMLCLEGGYERWKTMYPMKCHNPQYQCPKSENGDTPGLDGIEYPNFDDIQMKDDSFRPQIDRSMKQSALKAHELNKTPLELLEAKEKLLDKSLQNEKELMNLETEIKNIKGDKENDEDSSQKQQNIMFQIWQLQSKQDDIKVEGRTIDEQIDKTKDKVKEQEKSKVAQVEEELAKKEVERIRLQNERERQHKEREEGIRKAREEALRLARERKPENLDNRIPQKTQRKEELILSPKALNNVITPTVPTFDRSAKPAINTRFIYNEEDFSPVYGKVVSQKGVLGVGKICEGLGKGFKNLREVSKGKLEEESCRKLKKV
jgi:hypothetical protein